MNWTYSITNLELIFISLFLFAYLLYLLRIYKISKVLSSGFYGFMIKSLLRSIYFSLVIVAILGPSIGKAKKEVKTIGKDILICIDLSESMNATDVAPTRLEKMKFELKKLVETFSSDRIGLIMFSNEAFVQCPLTYDNNALNLFIQTLSTNLVPNHGTDFGPPLRMALKKLESNDTLLSESSKSKIIILISDGEDFGDETDEIIEKIDSKDIRLFTLGIGTSEGIKILTKQGSYKKDKKGNDIVTKLNPSSLKKIAKRTNGEYFEINKVGNDLERLMSAVNEIEGELKSVKKVDTSQNRYHYFLFFALVLLIVDTLLSKRIFYL